MAIVLQNTRTNSGLRSATFANNSALDNFRKSLQGLSSGLQKIDDRRDQQATDLFQNRLAGLSLNELENFNVNDAAQSSRLNAVTLRDMLKQRTADERAEQDALFRRQQIETERANAPLLSQYSASINNLRSQGTTKDEIDRFTRDFIANNVDPNNTALQNRILESSFGTGATVRSNNQAEARYQQQQADRQDAISRRAQEQTRTQQFNSAQDRLKGLLQDPQFGNNEAALREAIRTSPEYNNLSLEDQQRLEGITSGALANRYRPTREDVQLNAETKVEQDIQLGQLDQSEQALRENLAPITAPLDNPDNVLQAKSDIKDIIVKSGNTNLGTTARLTEDGVAGQEVIDMFDNITQKGLKDPSGANKYVIKPEELDAADFVKLLNLQHEQDNWLYDEGIPSEEIFRQALYNLAIRKVNDKELGKEKLDAIQEARNKIARGGKMNSSELGNIQENLFNRN